MKRTIAVSIIALALMAGATRSGADDREASCSCGTPASFPVRWTIHHSSAAFQQGARDSFALWSKYLSSPFNPTVSDPGTVDQTSVGNGQNDMAFFDFTQLQGGTDTLAGYAPSLPDGAFGAFNQCPIPSGQNCGTFTESDVWLNVAGGLRIQEPGADLAIAAAIASAAADQPTDPGMVFFGEVGLSGEVRQVAQAELRLKEAGKLGFTAACLPRRIARGNRPLAAPEGVALSETGHLAELVARFGGAGKRNG